MATRKINFIREKTPAEFIKKVVIVMISQVLFAIGLGLIAKVAMGQTAYGTLGTGIAITFGVSVGTGFLIMNVVLAAFLLIFYRKPLYVGSIIDAIFFGLIYNLIDSVFISKLPDSFSLVTSILLPIVGVFIIALAISVYVPISFGVTVFDGTAVFINHKFKVTFTISYLVLNSMAVIIGLLLGAEFGADVGYGTILTIVILGFFTDLIKNPVEKGIRKVFALPKEDVV